MQEIRSSAEVLSNIAGSECHGFGNATNIRGHPGSLAAAKRSNKVQPKTRKGTGLENLQRKRTKQKNERHTAILPYGQMVGAVPYFLGRYTNQEHKLKVHRDLND